MLNYNINKSWYLVLLIVFSSCNNNDDYTITDDDDPIDITISTSDFTVNIDENPLNNQLLGTITGTTNLGEVSFTISEQNPDGALFIDEINGELKVLDSIHFDFENNPLITGIVKVSNGNVYENASISITLNDVEEIIYGPNIIWQKAYHTEGGNHNILESIFQTTDEGYIMGGTLVFYSGGGGWRSRLEKLNEQGEIIWSNYYHPEFFTKDLKQTSDNGFIVGGSQAINSQFVNSYRISKFDESGNENWNKVIGGSNHDNLSSLKETLDGGYILAGQSRSDISGDKTENSQGNYDYWVIKVNAIGDIEWQNTIGGSNWDSNPMILKTNDNGYLVGGSSISPISGDKTESPRGGYDFWILKLNENGDIEWQKAIGGNLEDRIIDMKNTNDGGYVIGGISNSSISGEKTENSNGGTDYWVVKINSVGDIEWQNTIGGSNEDLLVSISQTSDNGFIIGGSSNSNLSGDKTENSQGDFDYWIVKVNSGGVIEWDDTIGGDNKDVLSSVNQNNDGCYILGGYSLSGISGDKTVGEESVVEHYWVLKYTNN